MTKEQIREREKEKLMSDVIGQSQVGQIEKIPNLKKRQRSIYYQPDGRGGWLPTRPLPSDATGRELYLSKGFKQTVPQEVIPIVEVPKVPEVDTDKEGLLSEITLLKKQLQMANARSAKKSSQSLSSTL
jgi:hypothetical protein